MIGADGMIGAPLRHSSGTPEGIGIEKLTVNGRKVPRSPRLPLTSPLVIDSHGSINADLIRWSTLLLSCAALETGLLHPSSLGCSRLPSGEHAAPALSETCMIFYCLFTLVGVRCTYLQYPGWARTVWRHHRSRLDESVLAKRFIAAHSIPIQLQMVHIFSLMLMRGEMLKKRPRDFHQHKSSFLVKHSRTGRQFRPAAHRGILAMYCA